jgi:hypothetical protein
MAVSGIITLCFLLSTFHNGLLLSVPAPESVPFRNFVIENEMEIVPSWEFQWRSFTEHVQNFWKILIPLFISLINILTLLMMQYLLYYKLQQRKEETECKLCVSLAMLYTFIR